MMAKRKRALHAVEVQAVEIPVAAHGGDEAPAEPKETVPSVAPATPGSVIASCLGKNEPLLAAAALLTCLDLAAAEGDAISRHAATLIRILIQDAPMPEALPRIPDDLMAAALRRLAAQLRQQESQIERLHSMLTHAL